MRSRGDTCRGGVLGDVIITYNYAVVKFGGHIFCPVFVCKHVRLGREGFVPGSKGSHSHFQTGFVRFPPLSLSAVEA